MLEPVPLEFPLFCENINFDDKHLGSFDYLEIWRVISEGQLGSA